MGSDEAFPQARDGEPRRLQECAAPGGHLPELTRMESAPPDVRKHYYTIASADNDTDKPLAKNKRRKRV